MRTLQIITLALLATAARADLFEQLSALHGLDESATLATLDAGVASNSFASFPVNADLSLDEIGPLGGAPTELIVTDRIRVWAYQPSVIVGGPYFPTPLEVLPGQPFFLNIFFHDDGAHFKTALLSSLEISDSSGNPLWLDSVGITSGSGFTYGASETVPEPSSAALLLGAYLIMWIGSPVTRSRKASRPLKNAILPIS